MPINYSLIEVFTNEEAKYQGKSVPEAVVEHVRRLKIAARCMVTRGIDGCYENGEVATQKILVLSMNMPLKIEVILPSGELDRVLSGIGPMVTEGIVAVRQMARVSHKTQGRLLPRQIAVKDVMTDRPQNVSPDTSLSVVAQLLLSSIFTGVPVVDDARRPLGIITQGDLIYRAGLPMRFGLLAASAREQMESVMEALSTRQAKEIMTHPAVTIGDAQLATEAVDLMIKKDLKRLPVVDKKDRLVGMLSRLDIFRTIMNAAPDWNRFRGQEIDVNHLQTVSDVLRRDTHTVSADTSVEDVLRIIDSDDIQRVAVIDEEGRLLGLILDRDLLMAFSDAHPGLWDFFMRRLPFSQRYQQAIGDDLRSKKAAQVMKTQLFTVLETASLDEAIRLMTENGLKRLPVVDQQGRFKGMISRDALLRAGFGG
jgi:CBS domain-containing protein